MRTDAAGSAHVQNLALLGFNLVCMATYLIRASLGWYVPAYDIPGAHTITGEPFLWFVGIFPVLIVASLLNLVWIALFVTRKIWRRERSWLFAVVLWIVTIAIDFAHH